VNNFEAMKGNVKLAMNIGGKSLLKWIVVVFTGVVITLIFSVVILLKNKGIGGGGHGGAYTYAVALFTVDFCGFILLFGSPTIIVLYFLIANKMVIHNTVYLLWKNKGKEIVNSKLRDLITQVFESKQFKSVYPSEKQLKEKNTDIK